MTAYRRFLLGGGGALMPVFISLLAIDIGAVLSEQMSIGNLIGFFIRYMILFIVGGVVAYLHEDEAKPFRLFELGIAAPALITSLVAAQGIEGNTNQSTSLSTVFNISIISSAYAETETAKDVPKKIIVVAWKLSDVVDGISGKAYKKISKSSKKENKNNRDDKKDTSSDTKKKKDVKR